MKVSEMSVELIDQMGSDLSVVNAARVSFSKESEWETIYEEGDDERDPYFVGYYLKDQDKKLISYLAKHNHWSPFAHTSLQFRIKAPIFVARQLVKHQVGGVWNEVSRRYVDDEPEFYFPQVWRGKPVNAKQGSSEETIDVLDYSCLEDADHTKNLVEGSLWTYNYLLKKGVAPEQARMVLPQNTMTEWIWTGSLMFFARVCRQRLDGHAQKETSEIATMIAMSIPEEFQHSWKALMT